MIQWAREKIPVSVRFNGLYSPAGSSFHAKDSFSSDVSFWHRDLMFPFQLRQPMGHRIPWFSIVLYNSIASVGRMGNALIGMITYLLTYRA